MFQRLKGAIDRGLAEADLLLADEPERLRPSSTGPARPSRAPRRTSQNAVNPSSRGKQTGPRASDGVSSSPSRFEPSPSTFEIETSVKEETSKGATSSPGLEADSTNPGSGGQEPEIAGENRDTGNASHEDASNTKAETLEEARAKARRLSKLEAKYQELLKAYRKAHARNSAIEPFETRLREVTPLTSITDPDAFVEFLNQLSVKGDMVMEELKRVSKEKDSIKENLNTAEETARQAQDELARLRSIETPGAPQSKLSADLTLSESALANGSEPIPAAESAEQKQSFNKDDVANLEKEVQRQRLQIEDLESSIIAKDEELETIKASLDLSEKSNTRAAERYRALEEAKAQSELELHTRVSALQDQLTSSKSQLADEENNSAELKLQLDESRRENEPGISSQQSKDASQEKDAIPSVQEEIGSGSKKKKNNKKKKKATTSTALDSTDGTAAHVLSSAGVSSAVTGAATDKEADLTQKITALQLQVKKQDEIIKNLEFRLKDQEDLTEEIDTLRDDLVNIGQEHVDTKDELQKIIAEKKALNKTIVELQEITKQRPGSSQSEALTATIKSLEDEKAQLAATVAAFETQVANATGVQQSKEALQQEMDTVLAMKENLERELTALRGQHEQDQSTAKSSYNLLENEVERYKGQIATFQTDLSAAQQLAVSRYRDLGEMRERFQKMQPELASLRSEVTDLRSTRKEQASRLAEIPKLEARVGDLRNQISSLRKEVLDRENDIKVAKQKYHEESVQRENLEEAHRKTQRLLQRSQKDKTDAIATKENIANALEKLQSELEQYKQFEDKVTQLSRDNDALRDELALKSAENASVHSHMSNLQDQATEIAAQSKETKERCESLEDELAEVSRQRDGRSREAETMRRLLAEVEGRAESRIKVMQDRLQSANEERDRAEDEASTIGRRRAKEFEDLKSRLQGAERDLKDALNSRDELTGVHEQMQKNSSTGEAQMAAIAEELAESKNTVKTLRSILEDGETQAKSLEAERDELKQGLKEVQLHLEKQKKTSKALSDDLRSLRASRLRPSDSPGRSTRSSLESGPHLSRVTSPSSGEKISNKEAASSTGRAGKPSEIDYVYLKNILLQFVEQKDRKHQLQLVPVLAMLLHFDKKDEQNWTTAITSR